MIGAMVESAPTESVLWVPKAAKATVPARKAISPVAGGRPISRAVAICSGSAMAAKVSAATASRGRPARVAPRSAANRRGLAIAAGGWPNTGHRLPFPCKFRRLEIGPAVRTA